MKTLFLILFSIVFISCEEGSNSPSSESSSPNDLEKSSSFVEQRDGLENGFFVSSCIEQNSFYFKYEAAIDLELYEVVVEKNKYSDSNCENKLSITQAAFDVNGEELVFGVTEFKMLAENNEVCGIENMEINIEYDIDQIDCDESFENKENIVTVNENNNYMMNGIEFFEQ